MPWIFQMYMRGIYMIIQRTPDPVSLFTLDCTLTSTKWPPRGDVCTPLRVVCSALCLHVHIRHIPVFLFLFSPLSFITLSFCGSSVITWVTLSSKRESSSFLITLMLGGFCFFFIVIYKLYFDLSCKICKELAHFWVKPAFFPLLFRLSKVSLNQFLYFVLRLLIPSLYMTF